ncbi:nucleoside triphosphate pyrophosphohydrolase [bacterium]|nr:nucleoside triphosphate pyrophosphohydrolase [bacterium]
MDSEKIPGKISELLKIIDKLLGPDGCPWDKEQTLRTMVKNLIEETYELADSIRKNDPKLIIEELGDLQFIILFLGKLAQRQYKMGLSLSIESIIEKLIRRHPHVFGEASVSNSAQVLENWEKIKSTERKGKGPLSGVPSSLPNLIKAFRIGEKLERIKETPIPESDPIEVLKEALDSKNKEELGKGLYLLVQKARDLGMDADEALYIITEELREAYS